MKLNEFNAELRRFQKSSIYMMEKSSIYMKDWYVEDYLDLLSTEPSGSRELNRKLMVKTTVKASSENNP